MRRFGRDENLIRVSRKVRNEGDCRLVLADDAPAIFLLGLDYILEKNAPGFREMPLAGTRFGFDCFENKFVA